MAVKKQTLCVSITVPDVLQELEALGTEQTKKTYLNHGAREPLFGVTSSALKQLFKKIKINYELSMKLYDTDNYDAMYLAGMIADPMKMTEADFEHWIKKAYLYMIGDFIVAVTLAESTFAQDISDKWIASGDEIIMSAGWNCYCWLLGSRSDDEFEVDKLKSMLEITKENIHNMPNRTRYAMNNFVMCLGISYLPLHKEAMRVANEIGKVYVDVGKTSCKTPLASEYIQKAVDKGRLGFKRKNVRC
jgi:3-methyladenine DNA glycosylase AlkD